MTLVGQLKEIADKIRNRTTITTKMTIDQMAEAIDDISGPEVKILDGTITEYKNDSITRLPRYYAFGSCLKLKTVELPNVTLITSYVFKGCTSLETALFPKLTNLTGFETFNGCSKLVNVDISNVSSSIGGDMFKNCTSLKTISAPKVTSYIRENCFYGCSSLKTVDMPNLTQIYSSSFQNCTSLESLDFPNVKTLGARAFYGCTSLSSINIPKVTLIENSTFYNCKLLARLDLPAVTKINGSSCFSNCSALETLILRETSQLVTPSYGTFLSNTKIGKGTGYIYVPSSMYSNYVGSGVWKTYKDQFRTIEDYPEICNPT